MCTVAARGAQKAGDVAARRHPERSRSAPIRSRACSSSLVQLWASLEDLVFTSPGLSQVQVPQSVLLTIEECVDLRTTPKHATSLRGSLENLSLSQVTFMLHIGRHIHVAHWTSLRFQTPRILGTYMKFGEHCISAHFSTGVYPRAVQV